MTDESKFPEAELARLADGSLPASGEQQLRARIEGSAELAGALAEQERAVSLIRALDEPAPEPLRARVDALTAGRPRRSVAWRWRGMLVLPAATALAVAVAALVVLTGGGSASPTVPQTARIALAAATLPAPAADPGHRGQLLLRGAGIPFPDWGPTGGWNTVGARTDTLGGRRVVTVFYTRPGGVRVGYAIVSGAPLRVPAGTTVRLYGVRFVLQRIGSGRFVTWRRAGHTCVIAGQSVGFGALLALATADELPAT